MRQRLEEIGHLWIEAWNSRDLERVLSLYDEGGGDGVWGNN